jgi:hypothetical protein
MAGLPAGLVASLPAFSGPKGDQGIEACHELVEGDEQAEREF